MKLFLQAPNDGIVINHYITVTVESIDGDEVRFSIDAPPWVSIDGSADTSEPERAGSGDFDCDSLDFDGNHKPTLAAADGE